MDGNDYLKLWTGDLAFQLAIEKAKVEELESSIPRKDVSLPEVVSTTDESE